MKPLFDIASVEINLTITQRANHARDILLTENLDGYDGVVCVGGDGTFSEVMNGLIVRTANDQDIDINEPNNELPRPKLRVGVIPGGSTDTIAYCIHGTTDIKTAVIHIIIGKCFLFFYCLFLIMYFVIQIVFGIKMRIYTYLIDISKITCLFLKCYSDNRLSTCSVFKVSFLKQEKRCKIFLIMFFSLLKLLLLLFCSKIMVTQLLVFRNATNCYVFISMLIFFYRSVYVVCLVLSEIFSFFNANIIFNKEVLNFLYVLCRVFWLFLKMRSLHVFFLIHVPFLIHKIFIRKV